MQSSVNYVPQTVMFCCYTVDVVSRRCDCVCMRELQSPAPVASVLTGWLAAATLNRLTVSLTVVCIWTQHSCMYLTLLYSTSYHLTIFFS